MVPFLLRDSPEADSTRGKKLVYRAQRAVYVTMGPWDHRNKKSPFGNIIERGGHFGGRGHRFSGFEMWNLQGIAARTLWDHSRDPNPEI